MSLLVKLVLLLGDSFPLGRLVLLGGALLLVMGCLLYSLGRMVTLLLLLKMGLLRWVLLLAK